MTDPTDRACKKQTRKEMAKVYADLIRGKLLFGFDINWGRVNARIIRIWSKSGLRAIKRMAWLEVGKS